MHVSWRMGASALLLLVAAGFPALAGAEPEHVRIQFAAPQGCPDEGAFLRAVKQRTARFQLASGAERTRRFTATVTLAGSSVSGNLEAQGPGAEVSLRTVSGRNCEEVVAALAFMTALAIDPGAQPAAAPRVGAGRLAPPLAAPANEAREASIPPSAAPSVNAAAPTPAGSAAPAVPPEPETLAPSPVPLPEPVPSSSLVVRSTTASATPVLSGWRWTAGAAGAVSLAVSPTAGVGAQLFVETAAPALVPILRGGLFVNQSDAVLASGAGARFQWVGAILEGCPARVVLVEGRLTLDPCLRLHLGVLRGQGRALDRPAQTTDLWFDLGPLARLRLATWARFFLELEGMLAFPLRRLTFAVQDRGPDQGPTTVFAVPLLGAFVGMGVAHEFR